MEQKKDIFISYKDNDEGAFFARQLAEALERLNYSVYFNPNEHKSADFTEKIAFAVKNCKMPGRVEKRERKGLGPF